MVQPDGFMLPISGKCDFHSERKLPFYGMGSILIIINKTKDGAFMKKKGINRRNTGIMCLAAMLLFAGCGQQAAESTDSPVESVNSVKETVSKAEESVSQPSELSETVESSQEVEQYTVSLPGEDEPMIKKCEFERDGKKIYAEMYLPVSDDPLPVVILSHGFGSSHYSLTGYGFAYARRGVAALTFDFIGGGYSSMSDGEMTDMSVLTEVEDLNVVIDEVKKMPEIRADQVYLFGESQGGLVSSYVAGKRPDEIAGLVGLYPAYVIGDDIRKQFPDDNAIPETVDYLGSTVGKRYCVDAKSFDIYEVISHYTGKVLLIHGTEDRLVPLSYSQKAAEVFPDAKLETIEGAGHGFGGEDDMKASAMAVDFVSQLAGIKG